MREDSRLRIQGLSIVLVRQPESLKKSEEYCGGVRGNGEVRMLSI
jgi:hypothetical protein